MVKRKNQKRPQPWPSANMNMFYQFNNSNGTYGTPGGIPMSLPVGGGGATAPPPPPPFVQLPSSLPFVRSAAFPQMPPQAYFQASSVAPQESKSPRPAREVFGALATWDDLPDPSTVEAVFLIDFMSLLHTPPPNLDLMDSKSAKLIESGLERASWYDRIDVLKQVIVEAQWNNALVEVISQANMVANSVVVVQTSRIIEHTPLIQAAFQSKGLQAHMFAHTDYSQPQKLRKHQLIQRLWHYYPESNLVYYQSPSSHRDTKELNSVFQRLSTAERALPMLLEVHNPRTSINPLIERKIIEQILLDVPNLESNITPDRWVWRIQNYDLIINSLCASGNSDAIVDYLGRSMDYDSDAMPVIGDRGKTRVLRATKLAIAGSKISLVFENEHTLPVASLKQRAVDTIWPVDFNVEMTLDMARSIVVKKVEDEAVHASEVVLTSGKVEDAPIEFTKNVVSVPSAPERKSETRAEGQTEMHSRSEDNMSSRTGSSSELDSSDSEYHPDSSASP